MNNNLLLFDVDGTLAESGQSLEDNMKNILKSLSKKGFHIGIVGGGKLDKILQQLGHDFYINHYFTECGCVYHENNSINNNNLNLNLIEKYIKNIRNHELYPYINILIKDCLHYLSQVKYTITGNFIDLRNGIVYVSLIGMSANLSEREYFIELDKKYNYRIELLNILQEKARELNIFDKINIYEGGSVGIAIYPKEYDKIQVLEYLTNNYNEIHYFGDKYSENGNDYNLINSTRVIGHKVDNSLDTLQILQNIDLM